MSAESPTPEEQQRLAEEIAEQLAKLKVEDLVVNTLMTVSSIGYRHVAASSGGAEADLEQTRLAIETMRALAPVLEGAIPAELMRDFNQAIANLQLGYAQALAAQAGGKGDDGEPPAG